MAYDAAGARRVETITQARREWKDAMSSIDFVGQFVMVSSYA